MKVVLQDKNGLQEAVRILKKGGVIAHPADTCFGLAADLMNPEALNKIQAIKGRDAQKPMSIMLSLALKPNLRDYAELDDFNQKICDRLLPGPVTILLPKGPMIPKFYFPETHLIGIRIPADSFTQELLNAFDGPLITTSANPSGKPLSYTHQEVATAFGKQAEKPDLILEGALPKTNLASTVILPQEPRVRIMRPGLMTSDQMRSILPFEIIE